MVKSASQTLNVATYNLEVSRQPERLIKNIYEMAKEGVDIFCLQEVAPGEGEQFIITKVLKRLGKDWQAEWSLSDTTQPMAFGNAIIWNEKVLKRIGSEIVLLPERREPRSHEKIFSRMIGFTGKLIIRRGLVIDFMLNKQKIRVCSVHADLLGGASHRKRQVRFLLDHLKTLSMVECTVIAGDFNTVNIIFKDRERKDLQDIFANYDFFDVTNKIDWSHDIYQANMGRDGLLAKKIIENFNLHFRQKLDYIWVQNLESEGAARVETIGSDHFPLIAFLKLKNM